MNTRQGTLLIVVLLLFLATTTLSAQDLYGSSADDSAAFVRLLNATSLPAVEGARLGSTRFDAVEAFSPYRAVRAGIYIASARGRTVEVVAQQGEFRTIVIGNDALTVFRDPRHEDPARAQLILYGAGASETVSLVTADGAVAVIEDVAPQQYAEVVVNAVEVSLAVVTSEEILATLEPIGLARGQSYAFAVLPQDRDTRVVWQQAEVSSE